MTRGLRMRGPMNKSLGSPLGLFAAFYGGAARLRTCSSAPSSRQTPPRWRCCLPGLTDDILAVMALPPMRGWDTEIMKEPNVYRTVEVRLMIFALEEGTQARGGVGIPPPPLGPLVHLDAPGQRRGQLPSSVWTRHGAVRHGQTGGSVGATSQGKGRVGQAERGRAQGGLRGRWAPPPAEGEGSREGQQSVARGQ